MLFFNNFLFGIFMKKRFFIYLLILFFALFLSVYLRPPKLPYVIGMKLSDASLKLEKLDYIVSTGAIVKIPNINCSRDMDIVVFLSGEDFWKANIYLNEECIVVDTEWKFRPYI
jgi:hypothetical protein